MDEKILETLPIKFKNYEILKLRNGASKRKYYRLNKDQQQAILMDSSKEPEQFYSFLKVHKIISNSNISIPKIYEFDIDKNTYYLKILEI